MGKGYVIILINRSLHRGVKLPKHGMKIIERVLKKRIRALVDFNEAQLGKCLKREQRMSYS